MGDSSFRGSRRPEKQQRKRRLDVAVAGADIDIAVRGSGMRAERFTSESPSVWSAPSCSWRGFMVGFASPRITSRQTVHFR